MRPLLREVVIAHNRINNVVNIICSCCRCQMFCQTYLDRFSVIVRCRPGWCYVICSRLFTPTCFLSITSCIRSQHRQRLSVNIVLPGETFFSTSVVQMFTFLRLSHLSILTADIFSYVNCHRKHFPRKDISSPAYVHTWIPSSVDVIRV